MDAASASRASSQQTNALQPDVIVLLGDYVAGERMSARRARRARGMGRARWPA